MRNIETRTQLSASERKFFKKNPNITGRAAEDNEVTLNPYSKLSKKERDSVIINEQVRIYMRQRNIVPKFKITMEQRNRFKNYGSDNDIRATIVGRIISGDPSAGNITQEQKQFAYNLYRNKK